MAPSRPLAWCLATALAAAAIGCGQDPGPPPPPPRPGATPPAPAPVPATGPLAPPPRSVTITQIMIAYRTEKGIPTQRTKEEAYELARSLIAKIRSGTPMEALLTLTDDVGPDGKPFNDGSVSLARSSPAQRAILDAAFSTPIGTLSPHPIDSGFGYHVIRRDH